MRSSVVFLFTVLAVALTAQAVPGPTVTTAQTPAPPLPDQLFEGTWSAAGQRQTLWTQTGVPAVTMQLSGAVAVTAGAGISRGFRGEVIGFDDGAGSVVGRAVWTDERGDRIFSALTGDGLATAGRQMRGTLTGGTGRYAGISGEYEFRWQYVLGTDGTFIHGRAVDLRGRLRGGARGQ